MAYMGCDRENLGDEVHYRDLAGRLGSSHGLCLLLEQGEEDRNQLIERRSLRSLDLVLEGLHDVLEGCEAGDGELLIARPQPLGDFVDRVAPVLREVHLRYVKDHVLEGIAKR